MLEKERKEALCFFPHRGRALPAPSQRPWPPWPDPPLLHALLRLLCARSAFLSPCLPSPSAPLSYKAIPLPPICPIRHHTPSSQPGSSKGVEEQSDSCFSTRHCRGRSGEDDGAIRSSEELCGSLLHRRESEAATGSLVLHPQASIHPSWAKYRVTDLLEHLFGSEFRQAHLKKSNKRRTKTLVYQEARGPRIKRTLEHIAR